MASRLYQLYVSRLPWTVCRGEFSVRPRPVFVCLRALKRREPVNCLELRIETINQLTRHFQKFGEVSVASIAFDWETGFSRGFGFVQFKDDSAASAALRVSHEISGTKVDVKVSRHSALSTNQENSGS